MSDKPKIETMNIQPFLRFYSDICSSVVQDITGDRHARVHLTLTNVPQSKKDGIVNAQTIEAENSFYEACDRLRDVQERIDSEGNRRSLYFAELKREERRAKYAVKKTEAVYDRLAQELA